MQCRVIREIFLKLTSHYMNLTIKRLIWYNNKSGANNLWYLPKFDRFAINLSEPFEIITISSYLLVFICRNSLNMHLRDIECTNSQGK